MKKTIAFMVAIAVAAALGSWVYIEFLGELEGPSGPISAIPIGETEGGAVIAPKTFAIAQDRSEARFRIHEELRGEPKEVVGTTDQIAGEFEINLSDLSASRIGPIQVNARTLVTDDDLRNRAIGNFILHSNEHEFITFTPSTITGLSGKGTVGDTLEFQVTGDLQIREIVKPATFDLVVKVVSAHELTGTAKSTVKRADFELTVPNLRFIANVGEEVQLEFEGVLAEKTSVEDIGARTD